MGKKKQVFYKNGRYCGRNLTDEDCSKLEKVIRMDKDPEKYVKDLKHVIFDLSPSNVDLIKTTKDNTFAEMRQGTLSNLQTLGVAFMYFSKNCILGDSVGLGKTVEVCGLLNLLKSVYEKEGLPFRFLYLTEKTLLPDTQNKLIQFTGDYCEALYGETALVKKWYSANEDCIQSSVVGVHSLLKNATFHSFFNMYENVYGLSPFNILIIDESGDVLSSSKTQYYKEASALSKYFERIVLLDATPFKKKLESFYNQLSFIDNTLLPTKETFTDTYVIMDYSGPYPQPSGKYKNAEEFQNLVGYRYFKRTRKGSGAVMKGCSAEVILCGMSALQRELLRKTSMPYMVRDCPSYFGQGIETNEKTTPKLKSLVDLVIGELKDVESILVYTRYKESQKILSDKLTELGISNMVLNGETPQDMRELITNRFKAGQFRLLITSVQKGLDFGKCNHCIFYSYDKSPDNMVQFEGRMTRSFDIIDKHVYLLITRGEELRVFKSEVADEAKASDLFAGSDFSCVLSLLLDEEKLKNIK